MSSQARDTDTGTPQSGQAHVETTLNRSERTRIFRRQSVGGSIICKEPLGPGAQARLRHESVILARLRGVTGVPQLARGEAPAHVIGLEEFGGVPLAQILLHERMALPAIVDLALALARIAAAVHGRDVVHRDINPDNILLSGPQRVPFLIDFDLARLLDDGAAGDGDLDVIAGTPAYLSPEQAGRSARRIDHRADLYGLGAVLYELLVGQPPFQQADMLEVLRLHLTRVPPSPAELAPLTPAALSGVVMRLLEKDPDRRYQSAAGLAHDLECIKSRLIADGSDAGTLSFPLGERDFPIRLSPPAQLIGRHAEREQLRAACELALRTTRHGVLATGPAGSGKTALMAEIRPLMRSRGGWYVSVRCDRQRQDEQSDAFHLVFAALARLLLAGADDDLEHLRGTIVQALGPNAGLLAAQVPELAKLLRVPPEALVDTQEAPARMAQAAEDFLSAVVSPARPLAIFIDDLQWATPASLRIFDYLLASPRLDGFLLAGACRPDGTAPAQPIADRLAAWKNPAAAMIRVDNLLPSDLTALLAIMLRMPDTAAEELATAMAAHTDGNPSDSVELLNAMRRDGILALTSDGWQYDPVDLRRYIGRAGVTDLLVARLGRLSAASRGLLAAMACLGGELQAGLLTMATGRSRCAIDAQLGPLLEDGLLERVPGADDTVRFRHDRVLHAASDMQDKAATAALQLQLARRLARQPNHLALAASQYLAAIDLVDDPREQHAAVALLHEAATRLRLANDDAGERMLSAALTLLARAGMAAAGGQAAPADRALALRLSTERHAALLRLRRFEQADAQYATLESSAAGPLALSHATAEQMLSHMRRQRPDVALALGLRMLQALAWDLALPPDDEAIHRQLADTAAWIAGLRDSDPAAIPEATDARARAVALLLERCAPAAFFGDRRQLAAVMLSACRLWQTEGACAALIGPLCTFGVLAIDLRGDYRLCHDLCRLALDVSSARGYALENARAAAVSAVSSAHWFSDLGVCTESARVAYDRLVQNGDMPTACYALVTIVRNTFEQAATLDAAVQEARSALEFCERTGNAMALPYFQQMHELGRALQGERDGLPEPLHQATPIAAANRHVTRAMWAALMGDDDILLREAQAAVGMCGSMHASYALVHAHLLHGVALARCAHRTALSARPRLLAELAAEREWLARRAADAPSNFGHLVPWLAAEQAWVEGDYRQASAMFDAALQAVEQRNYPWHHALLAERAGECQLTHGMRRTGLLFMADALRRYRAWGACAKVAELERQYPRLSAVPAPDGPAVASASLASVSGDRLRMLAMLRASQALSSETSLPRLQSRVAEQLSAMTGATQVLMFVPSGGDWALAGSAVDGDGAGENGEPAAMPVAYAADAGMLPLSVFRYAERIKDTVVVEDGANDERFAHDHFFTGARPCSLMVVPILRQGAPCAMLVLENRLRRGAFSAEGLDAVQLTAGQLAISLDHAALYASLERKVAERTSALEQANRELAALSVKDPLTGLANRRRFDEALDTEWSRARRAGAPMAGAMIDVDQFKLYNDHYGHQQGDACLQAVAQALAGSVRQGVDLVARYGGEEFAIILPGAGLEEVRVVAERARAAVAALALPHAPSTHGVVTVSVGIASLAPRTDGDPASLFGAADEALYGAKRGGRNRMSEGP